MTHPVEHCGADGFHNEVVFQSQFLQVLIKVIWIQVNKQFFLWAVSLQAPTNSLKGTDEDSTVFWQTLYFVYILSICLWFLYKLMFTSFIYHWQQQFKKHNKELQSLN